MLWREQQQQQQQQQQQRAGAGTSSSTSFSSAAEYALASAGLLGCQLLNPLWVQVVLTLPQPQQQTAGAHVVTAAGAAAAGSNAGPQQQQQQQQLVLYHAPSHGLVSSQRPAAYAGPAGGMLCDEMGEWLLLTAASGCFVLCYLVAGFWGGGVQG
jgi:hypothetical protein